MLLLRSIVRHEGVTAVVATHDPLMLDVADRVFELRDGRFVVAAGGSARSLRAAIRACALRGSRRSATYPRCPESVLRGEPSARSRLRSSPSSPSRSRPAT